MEYISSNSQENVFFYWDGRISESRCKLLQDCLYSTRVFNPSKKIFLVSNTITQNMLDDVYDIKVIQWNDSFFDGLSIHPKKLQQYKQSHPRTFSDLFRLVLLYTFGGSYIDTDDLCIHPITDVRNMICRSYDPHTCFYNKIQDNECIEGKYREIPGYEHIPMFPRNDCWINWDRHHSFLYNMLNDTQFLEYNDVISITGDFSWQSLTLKHCKRNIDTIGLDWNYGLTLLYLYEDFISSSSNWDLGRNGGEMLDVWNTISHDKTQPWGQWKVTKSEALTFYAKVCEKYPYVSHLWLHLKDGKKEWLLDDLQEGEVYSVSTWILENVREKINLFKHSTNRLNTIQKPSNNNDCYTVDIRGIQMYYYVLQNCVISELIKKNMVWKPHLHSVFEKFVTKESIVIECGCHIGTHTLLLASLCHTLHGFEPMPKTYEILCKNVTANNIANTILYKKGVADKEGITQYSWIPDNNPGGSGLDNNPMGKPQWIKSTNEYIEVELVTIDALHFDKLDFIKIDVEGYEPLVINGAMNTIQQHKPVIVMKVWKNHQGGIDINYTKELFKNLLDIGYNVQQIAGPDFLFTPIQDKGV